ncbi:beta-ketoacyl synthase N-terminal-like domain-containing protein [Pareuzebyella sediminis]|uniref:beta-ketoacyl synthase N-terminal-like domain-containing protein n=1 Tax=Pareuzebyella sediminis TaxID=2607998 RepID=UPI0011EDC32C|nr:beta-ketoacyl synthase N-terminal-like domain-containing protein [Pareuzebyella sediminis]
MSSVFLSHNNIFSAYGPDSVSAIAQIKEGVSSLQLVEDSYLLEGPFYSSRISDDLLNEKFERLRPTENYTRLEKILIASLSDTLEKADLEIDDRVGLIVSTTKGNIDVLEKHSVFPEKRAYLAQLGKKIKEFFQFQNDAIILSNACVSGVLALAVAKRLISQKTYDHVLVVGGDLVTKFIMSGFNAFQALSPEPCRPYCKTRSGINIGEVGSSVLVTADTRQMAREAVKIMGEASCNDANHISGPSRTGEGLFRSVQAALEQSGLSIESIDYISAHGTATLFNDEMEAIAFNRANLQKTPLNSLKGYFGHTLGASGLLETLIGMHSLQKNMLFASKGFQELGVSRPLNIIKDTTSKPLRTFIKTASGFGGCNTAAIFQSAKP